MYRIWRKKKFTSIPLPNQPLNKMVPTDHKTVYGSNLSHVKVNQEKEKRWESKGILGQNHNIISVNSSL